MGGGTADSVGSPRVIILLTCSLPFISYPLDLIWLPCCNMRLASSFTRFIVPFVRVDAGRRVRSHLRRGCERATATQEE